MNNNGNKNWVWGAFFIVCAILVILNGFGIFHLAGFLWKVAVSIFFVLLFMESRRKKDRSGMIIAGVVLFLIWKNTLRFWFLSFGTIAFATVLVLIGVHFFSKPGVPSASANTSDVYFNDAENEIIEVKSAFNSSSHYLRGNAIEKVYLTPSFCAMSVYLDQVGFKDENLEVIVDAGFCDLKIFIPKNWVVHNELHAMFGSIQEEGVPLPEGAQHVYLKGDANFSTVHIIRI